MNSVSEFQILLIAAGAAIMFYVMLKAIAQSAQVVAGEEITKRRADIARRHAEDAAAEAAGRAAALEPLATNPDGTIMEPYLAMVEEQSA